MTRTREENAADLQQEEARRTAIRTWLDTWRGGIVRRHIDAGLLDEDSLEEALKNDPLLKDAGADGFSFDDVAREALIYNREIELRISNEIDTVFDEPDLFTGNGYRWFRIDSTEKAQLASRLGETAVHIFWDMTRKHVQVEDSHEWLIMLDARNWAVVTMAAKKVGMESCYGDKLADCHVTGRQNHDAFFEYEDDIRDACAALGLECFPNHMGEPLPRAEESGLEP